MPDGIFIGAKGRILQLGKDVEDLVASTSLKLLLLKDTVESKTLLEVRTTVADIVANNIEANFDNYVRKTLTSVNYGTSGTEAFLDSDDVIWTLAGSSGVGVNNTLNTAVLYFDNTVIDIPLCFFSFPITTSGIDLSFTVPITGLYRI